MLEIITLAGYHDRSGFDCGVPELNSFLKATARQHGEKGISRTFVLFDKERPETILGYFTLTLCEVRTQHLPAPYAEKYPRHGLPAVRLTRLAVARRYQGKGYGSLLLAEAIQRTNLIAEQSGLIGLLVEAKNKAAHTFYKKYGFVSLPGPARKLFLPLATLRSSCLP